VMTDRDRTTRTRARASGAVGVVTHHGGALPSPRPGAVRDNRRDHEVHEGRTQTGCRTANAGSRLKPLITQEGTAWKASLPAVLGKTHRVVGSAMIRGEPAIGREPIARTTLVFG
jgi:hypothetical protein